MPIGAFKLNGIGRYLVSAAPVSRTAKSITVVGNAQISTAQSKFGGASCLMDGTGDGLFIDSSDLLFSGDYTYEWWIYKSATPTDLKALGGQGAQFSGNQAFLFMNTSNQIIVYLGGSLRITSTTTIANNTWTHVAMSKASGVHRLFIGGTLQATTYTDATAVTGSSGFHFGREPSASARSWNGYLDEFRISNTARYTATFTPSTTPFINDSNTIFLLHSDGTNASTAFTDDVGSRLQNGISALGNAQISTAQSKFGSASSLYDGSGDYLEIMKTSDLTLTSQTTWTIELWARFADISVLRGLMGQQTGGSVNNYGWGLYRDASNRILWYSGNAVFVNTTGWTCAANTWYHIALVRNSSQFDIYVDGTSYYSTSSYTSSTDSAANIRIGSSYDYSSGTWSSGIYYQNGYIDEIRISKTARYTANFTAPSTAFTNDSNTVLLIHADGTNASTTFTDDNA